MQICLQILRSANKYISKFCEFQRHQRRLCLKHRYLLYQLISYLKQHFICLSSTQGLFTTQSGIFYHLCSARTLLQMLFTELGLFVGKLQRCRLNASLFLKFHNETVVNKKQKRHQNLTLLKTQQVSLELVQQLPNESISYSQMHLNSEVRCKVSF